MDLKKLFAAALLALPLLGAGLPTPSASAMPMVDATLSQAAPAAGVEAVRWVCGPYGCGWHHRRRWRPVYGYRPYGYRHYGYRHYGYRPYGYRHHRYGHGWHHRHWNQHRYSWHRGWHRW